MTTGSALYRLAMGAALATAGGTAPVTVGYDAMQELLRSSPEPLPG